MNYLISAYSVNPYHGSEDGVGWNWVLQYEKNYRSGDRIILLTKRFNKADARRGMKEFGISHVELVITDVPDCLNWFREKHSVFHHMYYILWQKWAWMWVKKSGIQFDVIHHVTMGDYRIPSEMFKAKGARVIWGPVGGAQVTPESLMVYEKNQIVARFREVVNRSCSINPAYRKKIRQFTDVVASNEETYRQLSDIRGGLGVKRMVELGVPEAYRNLPIKEKRETFRILFAGRLIEKKGVIFLMEVLEMLKGKTDFKLDLCGGGYLTGIVSRLLDEYQLTQSVVMHGEIPHDEMLAYYQDADVFVLPSLRETGGTVLIEAMACGLPIVAFDTSFCTQLNEKGCGKFIDTSQPLGKLKEDFCDALVYLSEHRQEAHELGMNGYRYVNEELTWDNKYHYIVGKSS